MLSRLHHYGHEPFFADRLAQMPNYWNLIPAVVASVLIVEVPTRNVKAKSLNNDPTASSTIRVFQRMTGDVPDVGVVQPNFLRYCMALFQRLDRCPRKVHHLVVWMEPQEMNWRVRTQVIVHP